jgi:hypothetical protein
VSGFFFLEPPNKPLNKDVFLGTLVLLPVPVFLVLMVLLPVPVFLVLGFLLFFLAGSILLPVRGSFFLEPPNKPLNKDVFLGTLVLGIFLLIRLFPTPTFLVLGLMKLGVLFPINPVNMGLGWDLFS